MALERVVPELAGWLLTYSIHSTLLLGMVLLISRHLARQEMVLERFWRLGMIAPLVTASLQTLGVARLIGMLLPNGNTAGLVTGVITPMRLEPFIQSLDGIEGVLLSVGVAAWITVAGIGILRLMAARRSLGKMLGSRIELGTHPLGWKIAVPSGVPLRVTVSTEVRSPLVFSRRELCLPESALNELTAEQLAAVMAHEVAHLVRRDPLWLWVTAVLTRVFFFQPFNHLAARRLRALAEFLCDDRAVGSSSRLAAVSALVRISEWVSRSPGLHAVGMATAESLTLTRVRRMLDGRIASPPRRGALLLGVAFTLVLGAIGPTVGFGPAGPIGHYTIAAYDDAGPFTITLDHGRIRAATVNGRAVPPEGMLQSGDRVWVRMENEEALELTLTASGGMTWTSRPPPLLSP
jgi:Zn-dependent protease with chaperone function